MAISGPSLSKQNRKIGRKSSKNSQSTIIFGRVLDVSITPNTTSTRQTNWKYNKQGDWDYNQTGFIKFHPIGSQIDTGNLSSANVASPLLTNITKYPVANEIVAIMSGPSIMMNEGDPTSIKYYYFAVTSLWNNVQHNGFPDLKYLETKERNSSNFEFKSGITQDPFESKEELKFGDTFQEDDKIRALLPSEGDVIVEGRFGNSIRLGSSAPKQQPRNEWSLEGENGKPVVIIRNKQRDKQSKNPWDPTFEDINNDGSSLYMLSGQPLRAFEPAYINLQSLNLNITSAGDTSQAIVAQVDRMAGLGGEYGGTANPTAYEFTGQIASSSLSLDDQDKLGKEIEDLYKANNFKYNDGIWELNVTGIRNKNAGKGVTNRFDDKIVIQYKDESGKEQVFVFPITTQPGDDYMTVPYSSAGSAILKPGQYPGAYMFGYHNGAYLALRQQGGNVTVYRDTNKDLVYDDPNLPEKTGGFGINIHKSNPRGTSTRVNTWSAGCQVFANSEDFKIFLELNDKSRKYLELSRSKYKLTYTLIES